MSEVIKIKGEENIILVGTTGPQGAKGEGIAGGGTTGQVLAKVSDDDFDTEWITTSAALISINDIPDVTITTPSDDEVLTYDNGLWVNKLPTVASVDWGAISGDQSDINISGFTNDANYVNQTQLNTKQDELVSETNIKTINSESILGSGNIVISGGGGGDPTQLTRTIITESTTLNNDVQYVALRFGEEE
jgi:hypothetical protein